MSTVNLLTKALQSSMIRIMKPLIRILIRNGIPIGMFVDMAKWAYYEVAWDEFQIPYKRQTANRVAMITGLSRKEVLKFKKQPYLTQGPNSVHRGVRIISAWLREPEYHDEHGQPAVLPFDGGEISFTGLVKRYAGDITPQTVHDELVRMKTIGDSKDGKVKLLARAYIPKTDSHEKIKILGSDVSELIDTINHNLISAPEDLSYQRKVFYDNIPEDRIPQLKALLTKKAQITLEEMDHIMVNHDRDRSLQPVDGKGRVYAGVGIYYFEKPMEEETEDSLE